MRTTDIIRAFNAAFRATTRPRKARSYALKESTAATQPPSIAAPSPAPMPKAPAPAAPGPASAAVPGVIEGMMQNKRGENVPIVGNKTRIGTICGFEVYEVTSDIRLTDAPENEIWVKAMDPKEQQREQIAAQLGKKFAAQQKRTEAPAKYGAGPGPIVTEEPAVT